MRNLQAAIFIVGVLSFFASAFFIGQDMGDTLWRVGIAAMLVDLAWAALWPAASRT